MLVGATGAVGQAALSLALAEPRIAEVVALTRRPLAPQAKLRNVVADFAGLPEDADCWKVDAVICALGTTMKAAGSEARFAAVDRDLPVLVAQRTRAAGATRFALNSSLGANPSGNFYLRTKAEAEEGIRKLGFPAYTIVRPSLIDVERREVRPGERIGLLFARAFAPLIPRRYRAVKADAIAQALLTGALRDDAGECLVESEALQS
ncbi:MAG: NAD(P)H-binding protein [Burkholderiales bacterium]|nr:NAD(P)H-binding protein [Burkholderiales bacterium]